MAYRKSHNRHDEWVQFRNSHQAEFNSLGLPEYIFQSQDLLIHFLSDGRVENEGTDLFAISDEQFQRLEEILNAFFHDGWEQASWTAFTKERLRRFGRFA